MKFHNLLKESYSDKKNLFWEGTFLDYLEIVSKNPAVTRSAHARIYDMIVSKGYYRKNGITRYKFFEDSLFGIDKTIERLVEDYFHPAALGLDVKKRILLLVGPVSSGKSTIITLLKKGLEEYTQTDGGAIYAIKGCPMQEEPLNLLPSKLRKHFQKEYGIKITGKLCPSCRQMVNEVYKGKIENVKVKRIVFSEEERIGIGTFLPSDPKSQDISELTGSIDFSTVSVYGSESDPRAYRFDGELNIANRGILEFQELLKIDEKFLYHLLSLTQEGNFKIGRYPLISADEVIVAHTNQVEYNSFIKDTKNDALRSRIMVLPVPYTFKVPEETKIYKKLVCQGNIKVHLAPYALKTAAVFSILSRIKKLDGWESDALENINEGLVDENNIRDVIYDYSGENTFLNGMQGIDPRYVIDRIACALISKKEKTCITAIDILNSLQEGLYRYPFMNNNELKNFIKCIDLAKREYDRLIQEEIEEILLSIHQNGAERLFKQYLDNVANYLKEGTSHSDEKFMRSLEGYMGIPENTKKNFREEIFFHISNQLKIEKEINYKNYGPLKNAVEKKLLSSLREYMNNDSYNDIKKVQKSLIDKRGYCEKCADETLKYYCSLLFR